MPKAKKTAKPIVRNKIVVGRGTLKKTGPRFSVNRWYLLAAFVIIFGAIGSYLLFFSHADSLPGQTIALGDVNGDGRADLIASPAGGQLYLYLNTGTAATFSTASYSVIGSSGWQNFSNFMLGDVNGDGKADLIAVSTAGQLWQYINNGTATPFVSGTVIGASGWSNFNHFMLGDVNGDGKADLVTTSPAGQLWLYTNNGTSTPFTNGVVIGATGWQNFNNLTLGDTNGDGKADLITTTTGGQLWFYLNNGTSTPFVSGSIIGSSGWQSFNLLMLGDVNGDRKADLLATTGSGALFGYPNTGNASAPFSAGSYGVISNSGWQNFFRTPPPAATTSSSHGAAILAAAEHEEGIKYVTDAGNINGPTGNAFDCSGLSMYAVYQGAHVVLPHNAAQQSKLGTAVSQANLQPGDLVFFPGSDGTKSAPGHVGIYYGVVNGQQTVVDAYQSGSTVGLRTFSQEAGGFASARRY